MSKTTLHTPGPWVAGFGHQHAFRVYAGSLDGPIVANCNCVDGVATGLEAAANTELVAAAPDLQKSLESLLALIEASGAVPPLPEITAAHAALAKSRGEKAQ